MTAYDDLAGRLRQFRSAPFLFVGAGVSRRYLGADGWVDLLKRLAADTGRPYAYYATKANGVLPRVASEIAVAFHEVWWSEDRFASSRAEFGENLVGREAPLKVEVARYARAAMAALPAQGDLGRELALLAKAVVDGAITTNYDELLEHIFPDFRPYVGQDDLLFADAHGIGEIYKIHGSATAPESIVLTQADYERFGDRNPYLAAKLLAVFVEHPVVFIGYSLSDPDVTDVLVSIARVLTTENLERLRDHLIFVKWDPQVRNATLVPTQIAVAGFTIPVVLMTVPNYKDLFQVLSQLSRKFPARLLRRLKEHVYDLVLTTDPGERLGVIDIDIEDDTTLADLDVVFGVGVHRRLERRGYVGLSRRDLLMDVLRPDSELEAARTVEEALPQVLRTAGNTPIYRYLRGAGLLRDDGTLLPGADVDARVAARVARGAGPFVIGLQQRSRAARLVTASNGDLQTLIAADDVSDVCLGAMAIDRSCIDLEALRTYLQANSDALNGPLASAWAKAVALYDYYRFGAIDLPA